MKKYQITGASLEVVEPKHPFPYPRARGFQAEFLNWLHDGNEDVGVLQAPTGGGKTAAFTELIRKQNHSLVVYPTNALMRQQAKTLQEAGLTLKILNADSLKHSGLDRAEEILAYARSHQFDAIVTNPDIIQAIIQDQYVDYNARLLRFFDCFDGVIYDEFHAYDAFAASGLLVQLKLFSERRPNAKLTLASATPREDYLEFLDDEIGLSLRRITATYTTTTDPLGTFRQPITFYQHTPTLWKSRETIATELAERIEAESDLTEPRIALIFNSARESNDFYEYLNHSHPNVYKHVEKDNGYDTNDGREQEDDFYILNTTSKGEVGLDYDLNSLYMDHPHTASRFIQRIGRAGRKSEATVHVYGLGKVPWNETLTYESFLDAIWDTFSDPKTETKRLRTLTALRAAYALYSREQGNNSNAEMYDDFDTLDSSTYWKRFIMNVTDAQTREYGLFDDSPTADTKHLLEYVTAAFESLRTLRGRSLTHEVRYTRGNAVTTTEYDLLTALRQYRITDVSETTITLDSSSERPRSIKLTYEGLPRNYEYATSLRALEQDILDDLMAKISRNTENIETVTGINASQFATFVSHLPPRYAATPHKLHVPGYQLTVEDGTLAVHKN
jgi:CRISPR-associated endonuclease/helicase Cas3